MSNSLAQAIQEWHRKSKNNTYSYLARRIGVSQQTISKWASGVAAPSAANERRLQDIIAPSEIISVRQGIVTGCDAIQTADCRAAQDLPLRLFDPKVFERFCKDLFRLSGITDMEEYGTSGDPQYGIDLFSPSTKTVIQCKQTSSKVLALSSVRSAINLYSNKNEILKQRLGFSPSRKILAVSADLSAGSQQFARDNGWEYLTIHDLTDKVRDLPKNSQVRLLEKYFQNNRSQIATDCLGLRDVSFCIMEPMRYFDEIEKHAFKYYSLSNPFVESGSKLSELNKLVSSLVNASENSKIEPVLLEGYEGLGKTRLLKEFCIKRQDLKICVLANTDSLSDDDVLCATEHDVIVIDDSDTRTDIIRRLITASFSINTELSHRKKMPILLLATNPIGTISLRELFSEFYTSIDNRIIQIKDSSLCREIATSLLRNEVQAALVAQKSYNNPFLAVSTSLWLRDDNNRNKNLDSFSIAKVYLERLEKYGFGLSRRNDLARVILQFISILQPLALDTEFTELVKKYTDESDTEINTTIDNLLKSRLLQKSFGKVSIVPGLLGPFICKELLASSLVKNSTFFESILSGRYRNVVIINLAKLPKNAKEDSSDCIYRAWQTIKNAFFGANNTQKAHILRDLSSIAFYQPREMFELIEEAIAICHDAADYDDIEALRRYAIASLEYIAHDMCYLDDSIKLLLMLPISNNSRDPLLTAIKELLSPNLFKPAGYRLEVVNCIIRHLHKASDKNAVIRILHKSLDTNGITCISDNRVLTLYRSERNNTDSESLKIIKVLVELFDKIFNTGVMSEQIASIDMLGDIAHYYVASPHLGREKEQILRRLSDVCLSYENNEIVIAKAFLTLQRCECNFLDDKWQKIATITKNAKILLSILIIDPYWHDLLSCEHDYDVRQKMLCDWFDNSAKQILAVYEDSPDSFYADIKACCKKLSECNIYHNDCLIMAKVCNEATVGFNKALVGTITTARSQDIYYPIQALLAKGEDDYCMEYLEQQSNTNNSSVISSALISCFSSIKPSRALEFINHLLKTGDIDAIKNIVSHSDRLIERDESIFPSLVASFASINNPEIAHCVCDLFSTADNKKILNSLSVSTINSILKPLEEVDELDYSILSFLDTLADSHIESVIDYLFKRSENDEKQSFDFTRVVYYYGMPYNLKLSLSKDSVWKCIGLILSKLDNGNSISSWNLRKLLKALNLGGADISEIISDIAHNHFSVSSPSCMIVINVLLGLYKIDYLLDNFEKIESIVGLIMVNFNIGTSTILDSFNPCFIVDSKSRTPGEPCEYDLKLKELCDKALRQIPVQFFTRNVFIRAKSYAEQEIARDRKMDEEWGY